MKGKSDAPVAANGSAPRRKGSIAFAFNARSKLCTGINPMKARLRLSIDGVRMTYQEAGSKYGMSPNTIVKVAKQHGTKALKSEWLAKEKPGPKPKLIINQERARQELALPRPARPWASCSEDCGGLTLNGTTKR